MAIYDVGEAMSLKMGESKASLSQGVLAALAFALLLAGTNATTPLLPVYRGVLGFTPFIMSLTMVCYVSVLVAVLLLISVTPASRWSPQLLCGALAASFLSDIFLSTSTETGILVGRSIAGVAGGLGTGAAAALAVAALGAKGRSLSATGNLAGAVIGTSVSQVCVSIWHDLAMHRVFFIHAAACLIVLSVLVPVLVTQRRANRLLLGVVNSSNAQLSKSPSVLPIVIGSIVWAVITIAIVFLPSLFKGKDMILATNLGTIVLLIFSFAGQLGSSWLAKTAPASSGVLATLVGIGVILVSVQCDSSPIALLGLSVMGGGIGISYRLCLVVFTSGSPPSIQSKLSSRYAAITYAVAATVVMIVGYAGNCFGLYTVVVVSLMIFMGALILLSKRAPRLRDSFEPAHC